MERPCDVCGEPYEAKRATSKTCSARCRVAKSRGAVAIHRDPLPEPPLTPVVVIPDADEAVGPVTSALLQELTEADRASTSLGQAALSLARRVDLGRDTGAGLASLVKQLEATKNSATADVRSEATPLDRTRDQLAERRAKRGA